VREWANEQVGKQEKQTGGTGDWERGDGETGRTDKKVKG